MNSTMRWPATCASLARPRAMNCGRAGSGRHEILPLGETIYLNGVPFTIIGMFNITRANRNASSVNLPRNKRRKRRLFPVGWREIADLPGARRGVSRFRLKNATILPAAQHRVDEVPQRHQRHQLRSRLSTGGRRGRGDGGSPAVQPELKVASVEQLPQALQQIRNVLMSTHRGIEDFTFRTRKNGRSRFRFSCAMPPAAD